METTFDLERFVGAQAGCYEAVRRELAAGEKRTHWMWFIFPQIRGLGSSTMAQRYAISGLAEAQAYLAHPVLGARLRECTRLVNAVRERSVEEIFGYPDNLKFHSSMTLFDWAAKAGEELEGGVFTEALGKYFGGVADGGTMKILGQRSSG